MSTQNLPANRPQRAIVTDAEALYDTAQFEHMARIASMMGSSSLMPEHLRVMRTEDGQIVTKDTPNTVARYLDEKGTTANAFLIVNQARLFGGIDPFALAQVSYFVHGRLGYEGKLVQAVLERRIGAMTFEYAGEPGTLQYGIKVTGWIPGSDPGRQASVEGTVEEWQTKTKYGVNQQWQGKAGQHRMLHYRGTREWARLYAPGLTIGLLDDDDLDALREDHRANRAKPVEALASSGGQPAISARAFNPMEDEGDVEDASMVVQADAATTAAPKTEKPPTAAPGALTAKPDAKVDTGEQEQASAERRAPRGTPARVEKILMRFQSAATIEDVHAIHEGEVLPLQVEMKSLGVNFASQVDRLAEAQAVRIALLEAEASKAAEAHKAAQAKAAGANPVTGEVSHDVQSEVPAERDFTALLEDFRTKAAEVTTFDALDALVEKMFDAEALPAAEDAEVDEIIEQTRTRIAMANQQADAEDTFPGDREAPHADTSAPAQPAVPAQTSTIKDAGQAEDETPLTDEQLQEVVDGWSTGMRKCKTVADLEVYNRNVITPFMAGPYQPRMNKEQVEDARTTYKNRHKLLTKKEAENNPAA